MTEQERNKLNLPFDIELKKYITHYRQLVNSDRNKYKSAVECHIKHTYSEGYNCGYNYGKLLAYEEIAESLGINIDE